VIERLDARRTQGGARFVIIIGASGSGKSSLLKASVLPLLARRRAQWVILPDIRPEKAPIEALAKALAQHKAEPEAWRGWHERLSGADGAATLERLVQDARIARRPLRDLPADRDAAGALSTADRGTRGGRRHHGREGSVGTHRP
jgi:hypothetical protein